MTNTTSKRFDLNAYLDRIQPALQMELLHMKTMSKKKKRALKLEELFKSFSSMETSQKIEYLLKHYALFSWTPRFLPFQLLGAMESRFLFDCSLLIGTMDTNYEVLKNYFHDLLL